jgi:hypothetical protein
MMKNTIETPSQAAQFCAEEILRETHISIGEAIQIMLNFIAEGRKAPASITFTEEILALVFAQIDPSQAVA